MLVCVCLGRRLVRLLRLLGGWGELVSVCRRRVFVGSGWGLVVCDDRPDRQGRRMSYLREWSLLALVAVNVVGVAFLLQRPGWVWELFWKELDK